MIPTNQRGGKATVNHCAHCGIESSGVNNPLISMNSITKKNITKMHCCIVSEIFATAMANPDIASAKTRAAK